MNWTPLGEQALLGFFADEASAVRFAAAVRQAQPDWLEDVVPAYASVGVFFNADAISQSHAIKWLSKGHLQKNRSRVNPARSHFIPVCYERGLDLAHVASLTGLATEAIIALHLGTEYHVHAIGFIPGFPYMGYLPEALCGIPRLDSPRIEVPPGSVGITGRQTAIYPLPRPGGWCLIGQTPLTLVDVADAFFPIAVGDRVTFTRIDTGEYDRRVGERLPVPVEGAEGPA